jgi:hypothetical protein
MKPRPDGFQRLEAKVLGEDEVARTLVAVSDFEKRGSVVRVRARSTTLRVTAVIDTGGKQMRL